MVFFGGKQLVKDFFYIKNQNNDSIKYSFFFPWLAIFCSFCCAHAFLGEFAQLPPLPHKNNGSSPIGQMTRYIRAIPLALRIKGVLFHKGEWK